MANTIVNLAGAKPYVTQIQNYFRASIRKRQMQPGQKLPSMRELSETCGVSLGIVKQALATLVTEGYLRSHPGRGVFVCEPRLSRQNIALVLPSLDTEQMPRIIRGVKEALSGGSGRLIVQAADFDFDQEADLLTNLDTTFVAGAIIYPPPLNSYIAPLQELKRRGVPFVLVDTFFETLKADVLASDRRAMGAMAFEHLLERGHRKIGMVDNDADAVSVQQLRQGADEALKDAGLSFEQIPRVQVESRKLENDQPWAQGQAAAARLLNDHPDLTALIGVNDNISMGAFRAVKAAGKRVPDDVSVISIGDLTSFESTEPAVTAVDQDLQAMGRMAGERLMEILKDPCAFRPAGNHTCIRPALKERGSVKRLDDVGDAKQENQDDDASKWLEQASASQPSPSFAGVM